MHASTRDLHLGISNDGDGGFVVSLLCWAHVTSTQFALGNHATKQLFPVVNLCPVRT